MAMETDLVRTLKQIISLRSAGGKPGSRIGGQSQQETEPVKLFGKSLCPPKAEEDDRLTPSSSCATSEKLLPTAILQHLMKRKAARQVETSNTLTTLPLLNQDKGRSNFEEVPVKRQRTGQDQARFAALSGSKQAPTSFQAQTEEMRAAAAGPEIEPDMEAPPSDELESSPAPPLTVFYNGQVFVYEDISAEKAQAIMILAGSTSSNSSRTTSESGGAPPQQDARPSSSVKRAFTLADLPQARKASLQRFLVKRKERLVLKGDKVIKSRSPGTPGETKKFFSDEAQARAPLHLVRSQ